ncbi:MAG: alkaline phosphatase family protein [Lysobacterales bacterium]|jgi:predicted AlkP superfamily phosphohydrolase/phosphomutase
MTSGTPHRLVALGLDGGDLAYIRRNRRSLPVLSAALERGVVMEPHSPEALSGAVWPTFYNGCSPGVHGVYQHLVWDPQRMGLRKIRPDWCYYHPFWREMDRRSRRVAVIDVPYSFPSTPGKGLELTDWATHGQTWPLACSDPRLKSILRELGPSPIGRETPVEKSATQLAALGRRLESSAALKGELLVRILQELRPGVLISVFGETHRGGHTLFGSRDEEPGGGASALLDVYRAVDAALGRVLETVDEGVDDVLLFSVHGMQRDHAQCHLVRPLLSRVNRVFLEGASGSPGAAGGMGLVRRLRSVVPARLQHAVGAASPDWLRQWVVEREMIGGLDWSRTPGFALRTDIRTELRLNLKGREARGFLEQGSDEERRYTDLLSRTFLELEDVDTGRRLVDEVVPIHERFPGPGCERLPDLVVTWRPEPPARRVESPGVGRLTVKPTNARGGDHVDRGFAVLNGPASRRAESLPPLQSTEDFADFLLALAG